MANAPDSNTKEDQVAEAKVAKPSAAKKPAAKKAASKKPTPKKAAAKKPAASKAAAKTDAKTEVRPGKSESAKPAASEKAVIAVNVPRMKQVYRDDVVSVLIREFGYSNPMQCRQSRKLLLILGLAKRSIVTRPWALQPATCRR